MDDDFTTALHTGIKRRTLFENTLLASGGVLLSLMSHAAISGSSAGSDGSAAARLTSGQAWDDYCDMIKLAGHQIELWGNDVSDTDRAEWYRFLSRLMRNGFERFVENSDPLNPRLRDAPWRCFINMQNPDQDHLMSEFSADADYIITGSRGTVPYFIVSVWSSAQPANQGAHDWTPRGLKGLEEFNPAMLKTGAFLSSRDMEFAEDGSFRIYVSRKPQSGNWLALDAASTGLIVRTVYHDRRLETAPVMRIERVDQAPLQPVQPADLAADLAKSAQLVLGYTALVRGWWQNFSRFPNQLRYSMAQYLSNGGVADRQFAFGAWNKPDGDALVFEFTPPECEHWIFQLCNIWQENLDTYEHGGGYVTKFTVKAETDGSVRLIVAETDPGIGGNWINSFGHVSGLMGLRLIQTDAAAAVRCYRLPLQRLAQGGWAALADASIVPSVELAE